MARVPFTRFDDRQRLLTFEICSAEHCAARATMQCAQAVQSMAISLYAAERGTKRVAYVQEANLWRKLRSKDVVKLIGIGAKDLSSFSTITSTLYIVCEYMEGGTLREAVERQMLSTKKGVYAFSDVFRCRCERSAVCTQTFILSFRPPFALDSNMMGTMRAGLIAPAPLHAAVLAIMSRHVHIVVRHLWKPVSKLRSNDLSAQPLGAGGSLASAARSSTCTPAIPPSCTATSSPRTSCSPRTTPPPARPRSSTWACTCAGAAASYCQVRWRGPSTVAACTTRRCSTAPCTARRARVGFAATSPRVCPPDQLVLPGGEVCLQQCRHTSAPGSCHSWRGMHVCCTSKRPRSASQ